MTATLLTHDATTNALARFAAAMGLLALIDEELAAAQKLVDHSVERAVAEARGAR
ncbi:hypothetical protein ACQP2T_63620 (plasmid) [Nonomuraea sp. CA-143628]|uniref:hypothetical protein n=1 Tax=Nonomuraea sp. CA-143628 TaxID=3239997 RepID=UPI003D914266